MAYYIMDNIWHDQSGPGWKTKMKERNFVEQVIQANHSAAARLTGAAGNSSFRLPSLVPV